MTKISDKSGKYEFPYSFILEIAFTQNQLKNISEPNITKIVFIFWTKKHNLIESRYNELGVRITRSIELGVRI